MSEATYEGFIQFVNRQPAGQTVQQNCMWEECAVGDYEKSLLEDVADFYCGTPKWLQSADEVLFECLNNHGSKEFLPDCIGKDIETYGDLQDYFKWKANN